MNKKHVWLLRASSIWVFYVWGVLVRNMIIDRKDSLAFRAVHITLALVSVAFAVAVWSISNRIAKDVKSQAKLKLTDGASSSISS